VRRERSIIRKLATTIAPRITNTSTKSFAFDAGVSVTGTLIGIAIFFGMQGSTSRLSPLFSRRLSAKSSIRSYMLKKATFLLIMIGQKGLLSIRAPPLQLGWLRSNFVSISAGFEKRLARLMKRLSLCVAAWLIAIPGLVFGQADTATLTLDPSIGISTMPLWDGVPPGSAAGATDAPTLTVFLPQRPNGTSVIIAPGGSYMRLSMNLEGRQVADWFAVHGVTAFVLKYRLGPNNLYPIPLQDAQRAVRVVRSLEKKYRLSDNRIGMVGFSAGGHLAAMTGTSFGDGDPAASDPINRLSDRPDFLVLGYPWLNAMQPNDRKMITYCSVLKTVPADTCKDFEQRYTPSVHVTSNTPPTFIYSTFDDHTVPIQTSVDFYTALIAAGVPSEIHIFRHGVHGSGLGSSDAALDEWPALLEQWMRDQGWLTVDPVAVPAK
jgi:acetyl esterase/lipase